MYCKAQLSGDSQNKPKMSLVTLKALPMTIQIYDQNVDRGYNSADRLPVRQNETVPVEPFGAFGIGVEKPDRSTRFVNTRHGRWTINRVSGR